MAPSGVRRFGSLCYINQVSKKMTSAGLNSLGQKEYQISLKIGYPVDDLFHKKGLVDETQISKPPEATRQHNNLKLFILLPLRAELLCILHYETPRSLLYRGKDFLSKSLLGRCVVE